MVYTAQASRRQQFYVQAPAMQQLKSDVTTWVDSQNALCKAIYSHSFSVAYD